MAVTGSDERYLKFYESYARSPIDELNSVPKGKGDYRERVERETIRGRYGVFHHTLEEYIYRHWRGYTVPRVGVWWFASYCFMHHGVQMFNRTFPNLVSYKRFRDHPNYKLLGPVYSYFYMIRPIFWTYIFFRMSRMFYYMVKRHL